VSKVYVIGDFHFGHKNILKYRPQFKTIDEHDNYIIDNFNKVVKKRDTVYFMGDIFFTNEGFELMKRFNYCHKKVLVLGNHCFQHFKGSRNEAYEYFDEIISSVKKKGCWLTHIPINEEELRGAYNIHAHTHNHNLSDKRYYNTSCENIGFTPRDLMDIVQELKALNPIYEGERIKVQKERNEFYESHQSGDDPFILKSVNKTNFKENNYDKRK